MEISFKIRTSDFWALHPIHLNFSLKDLFRENFISPFVFTPLEHLKFIEKNSKSKNRPLKFDLKKCPGSNQFVPCSNQPKIAVETKYKCRLNHSYVTSGHTDWLSYRGAPVLKIQTHFYNEMSMSCDKKYN